MALLKRNELKLTYLFYRVSLLALEYSACPTWSGRFAFLLEPAETLNLDTH